MSTLVCGPLIEIWIGVFISIIAFYLGCPFRVVVLLFAIDSRKFGTKFLKISERLRISLTTDYAGLNGFGIVTCQRG